MSKNNYQNQIVVLRRAFEEAVDQATIQAETPIEMIKPMVYSLQTGGKRLRPLLLLATLAVIAPDQWHEGMSASLALEYIHTYSLIHDDLPAMDNDDLRRGQPTNHIMFDEATAILAGDALLTDAFGIITSDPTLTAEVKVALITALVQAAGSRGMVAGQLTDIKAELKQLSFQALQEMHELKTGKLFAFAIEAALLIAQANETITDGMRRYVLHFGRAYQIHNDLMDVLASEEETGKTAGRDQVLHKSTYPSLLGTDQAFYVLKDELNAAYLILDQLSQSQSLDFGLLTYFLDRINLDDDMSVETKPGEA